MSPDAYDYIIIGSGAGGGPLAANLARFGFKVLLMEAGGDPSAAGDMGRLMYQVPIFHGAATEYDPISWNFYVRHYTDDEQQAKDSKKVKVAGRDKIWYPRAGALGGCTAHHAMITVVPQDSDWNNIARITGDDSWRAENMRPYFTRLENCTYAPPPGSLTGIVDGIISSIVDLFKGEEDWADWSHGHGFKGWLTTSIADPKLVLRDPQLIALLLSGIKDVLIQEIGDPLTSLLTRLDPNDSRNAENNPEGLAFTPLAVDQGQRHGPREFVRRVQAQYPDNLTIKQYALASRILFEGNRAVGVEYIDRAHVYAADPQALPLDDQASLPLVQVKANREVILAAGAFNSPQLLMLSGVGPRAELEKFGIKVVADLPGVGQNLQDRYEVGVIADFTKNFDLLSGGTFGPPDPGAAPDAFLQQWLQDGTGVYATNGALIGIIKRSRPDLADPDLYIFGLPSYFKGYEPGYSKHLERYRDKFTWAILKARTSNTGRLRLASKNPWDPPDINFQYFGDGRRENDPDLEAVLSGVKFVRNLNQRLTLLGLIKQEEVPGPQYQNDDDLREFIKNEAWGHHASCTNKIGADDDPLAVLDSRFRVRQTQGLRVVDASIFPKIPGYFIVTAIYMISEKAADVIMEDARR